MSVTEGVTIVLLCVFLSGFISWVTAKLARPVFNNFDIARISILENQLEDLQTQVEIYQASHRSPAPITPPRPPAPITPPSQTEDITNRSYLGNPEVLIERERLLLTSFNTVRSVGNNRFEVILTGFIPTNALRSNHAFPSHNVAISGPAMLSSNQTFPSGNYMSPIDNTVDDLRLSNPPEPGDLFPRPLRGIHIRSGRQTV